MNEPTKNKRKVLEALNILLQEKTNTQKEVLLKLNALETKISQSTLSNLIRDSTSVSLRMISSLAPGFCKLLEMEFCLRYDDVTQQFEQIPEGECTPQKVIDLTQVAKPTMTKNDKHYVMHDGRQDYHEKLAFYKKANAEVIEIGIRLRNFKNYFTETRESAFSIPITELLKTGIDFNCYIVDKTGNFARRYFEDRALVQAPENEILDSLPIIKEELRKKFIEINERGYKGKMKLFEYDHFPYFHASVIDGGQPNGAMLMAPYLYGVSRLHTPVIELDKKHNKIIFDRYWKSVKAMINYRVKPVL